MNVPGTRYLLDTSVVSEWVKLRPDSNVVAWLGNADEDRVFLSVVTLAEISRGIALLPAGRRRERLATWLVDDLLSRFEGRILDIDRRAAMHWGVVAARCEAAGVSMTTIDVFLAATADVHDMTLVTRNTRDFRRAGIPMLDPWRVDDSHV